MPPDNGKPWRHRHFRVAHWKSPTSLGAATWSTSPPAASPPRSRFTRWIYSKWNCRCCAASRRNSMPPVSKFSAFRQPRPTAPLCRTTMWANPPRQTRPRWCMCMAASACPNYRIIWAISAAIGWRKALPLCWPMCAAAANSALPGTAPHKACTNTAVSTTCWRWWPISTGAA